MLPRAATGTVQMVTGMPQNGREAIATNLGPTCHLSVAFASEFVRCVVFRCLFERAFNESRLQSHRLTDQPKQQKNTTMFHHISICFPLYTYMQNHADMFLFMPLQLEESWGTQDDHGSSWGKTGKVP